MINQGPPGTKIEADRAVSLGSDGLRPATGGLPETISTSFPQLVSTPLFSSGPSSGPPSGQSSAAPISGQLITFTNDGQISKIILVDVISKKSTTLFTDEKSERKIIVVARLAFGADSLVAVLAKEGDASGQLVAIPLDGSGKATVLQDKFASSEAPTISPDQTKIARTVFSTDEQDFGFTAIVEPIVGGNQSIVARDPDGLRALSFSPDGKSLAYISGPMASARAVMVVDLAHGKNSQLYESNSLPVIDFRWSGSQLLVVLLGNPGEVARKILIVDMASKTNVEIAPGDIAKLSPLIAPDGSGIAYIKPVENRSADGEVVVAGRGGDQPTIVGKALELIGWIK